MPHAGIAATQALCHAAGNACVRPVPTGEPSSYTIRGAGQLDAIGLVIGTGNSITETVPTGWQLDDASCVDQNNQPTGTKNNPFTGITGITISSGQITTCTFKNSQLIPHIKVVDSIDHYTDADGSGTITSGDTLFYKFVVTNDGSVPLNPVTVTDNTFSLTVSCPNTSLK